MQETRFLKISQELKISEQQVMEVVRLIAEGATPTAAITAAGMAQPGAALIAPSRRRTFHRGEV